ncbi:MAG: N-acetylglucosamine-6-phosphate deacetylase, partial [Rhodobacteraceae bacterium]|nr:N-acetylglucosamine-6-phosphate deacetylase [Paracoccaceae bacterium]
PVGDRMILVSDAMPTVAGPDAFDLYGQRIRLRDGRLVNGEGALAGAHVTMLESVRNVVQLLGRGLEEALRMSISHPAALMGREDLADIRKYPARDVILIDNDLKSFEFPLE